MDCLLIAIIFIVLVSIKPTRRFTLYMLPWILFGFIYSSFNFLPNYEVNSIDVRGLYDAEKSLFGINTAAGRLIPGEWFAQHTSPVLDFMGGLFYLCWVPVPIMFSLYLYFTKHYEWMTRFTWAFLITNLIGFIGYYVHPAAPPWYAMNYGFTPILHTPGNVAGLGRWDAMMGINLFHSIYGKNANVFAAVPSLHAAYLLVTTIYSVKSHRKWYTSCLFGFICAGIWFTAVYMGHHYIIDVLLGILTAIIGVIVTEALWRRPRIQSMFKNNKWLTWNEGRE